MSREVRIALVEDSAGVRREIARTLRARPGWQVVAECANGKDALKAIPQARPDLILLDICLQEENGGVELIRPLKAALPKTVVIMLTVVERPKALFRAFRLGAYGYLVKRDKVNLVAALEEVLVGGPPPMSPSVARLLQAELQKNLNGAEPADHGLTPREWEVLRLTANGKQQGEIALALGISVNTVKVHRRKIHEKLGAGSAVEALIRLRNGSGLLDE